MSSLNPSSKSDNFSVEIRSALTIFLTMAYILFVNPDILALAMDGVSKAQIMTATALCAAVGSILMGLLSGYPFALAPGMGLNAFFVFGLVKGAGISWQGALACVFLSGVVFLLLSVSGVRRVLVESIPLTLKYGMMVGIGLFLCFIGFKNAGIVVAHPETLVTLGPIGNPGSLTCIVTFLFVVLASVKKWPAPILLGLGFGSMFSVIFGFSPVSFEQGVIALPVLPQDLFLALDFGDIFSVFSFAILGQILILLFVDFFDTAGTLYGLSGQAGYLDEQGKLPKANKAFLADALATIASGVLGSSPTTTYIESSTGIASGGRSGRVAIYVGILFLSSTFFWPLLTLVPAAASSAALIYVGCLMIKGVVNIDWHDTVDSVPAFLIIVLIPLSFSIADGIALGIIAAAVFSSFGGKFFERKVLVGFGLLLVARYVFL